MSSAPEKLHDVLTASSDDEETNPRLDIVRQIEWAALIARYVLAIALLALYATGYASIRPRDVIILPAVIAVQNVFVHWVLHTRRYALFITPLNFAIHLAKASALVALLGAPASPLAVVYLMLIMAFCLYSPNFRGAPLAALICCAAYAATILAKWAVSDTLPPYLPVVFYFMAMILCGLLMDKLGRLLETAAVALRDSSQAHASAEATLRAILDNAATPIVVFAENQFITEVNEPACAFFGLERDKLVGQRFRGLLFDDGTLDQRMAGLSARGEYEGELVVIDAEGDEHVVDALARTFMRDQKRFYVTMFHDITQQKDIQEKSRMTTLKLAEANRELKRVDELRRNFFATISQRLRSPLSSILGYADLMLNEELGELTDEQRKALHSCSRSVMRMFDLVDEAAGVEIVPVAARALEADGKTSAASPAT